MSTQKPKQAARWNPTGERNPRAILTADKVRDIRRELMNGVSRTALGHAYGVTPRTIRAVQERQTWPNVL